MVVFPPMRGLSRTEIRSLIMKMLAMILALTITAPLAFTACEHTSEVSVEKTKSSTDGTTSVQKKTVTEHPSGDVTVHEEKTKTVNP
jgi:hypothetical protein